MIADLPSLRKNACAAPDRKPAARLGQLAKRLRKTLSNSI